MDSIELELTRFSSGEEATLGVLHRVAGSGRKFVCYTLEDQFQHEKVMSETRIPAGRYEIKFRHEGGMIKRYKQRFPWHDGMLWLQDVPGFEWVYIHVGNKDDDTDGCVLVGHGQSTNVGERGQVTTSVAAYRDLCDLVYPVLQQGGRVHIRIEDKA